ncbi:DUF805 domain-containing protein [Jannaschia sp. 2305UL9-9]|uniref:DUF805 domain-containing protein n=1 Tax=Jannaschia sp. 2305UL9-9 TaxID=3121638 RepID=UPI0035279DA3
MGPIAATIHCLKTPFTWKGRASPSEYWWFTLAMMLIQVAALLPLTLPFIRAGVAYRDAWARAEIVAYNTWSEVVPPAAPDLLGIAQGQQVYWMAFGILMILPLFSHLSVMVRRLHDSGRSGWWYWIILIPIVGPILLLIFLVVPGEVYRNRFGPGRQADLYPRARRGSDMPVVPRDPLAHLQSAEDLRGLRHSRMPGV